jgi:predicted methyltransferase
MRKTFLLAAVAAMVLASQAQAETQPTAAASTANIASAVSDKARPEADLQRDADRKPADMLAFAEVRPGQTIAELLPGGGYFTRIFAKAVGPNGKVYAVIGAAQAKADKPPAINAVASDTTYGNITVVASDFTTLALAEPVDLVWTSQNYHDLHPRQAVLNKAVFTALKSGGLYVVLDHAAAPGASLDSTTTVHRIDPAIVKAEVEAAGFKFVGEDTVLRNVTDDHTKAVFDPAIRGHTDQFVYKFRKP